MTIEEILTKYWGVGAIVLLSLIQIAPIKINPWTWVVKVLGWIAKKIGNAFSHDVLEELKVLKKETSETKTEVATVKTEVRRNAADLSRRRILAFEEDLINGVKHTRESFRDVMIDIDVYEAFCESDKEYKNTRADLAIENIKAYYKDCSNNDGFL